MPRKPALTAALGALALLCSHAVLADPDAATGGKQESLDASVCRIIEQAAHAQNLPVAFLTRLIWQESRFEPNVISPAGAEGIAQFMPRTADARGLVNPFDPEEAIPKAAELLAELAQRFGNIGFAAAAYNAGPGRVQGFIGGTGDLPAETRSYVLIVTRHTIDDWAAKPPPAIDDDKANCLQMAAEIRRSEGVEFAGSTLLAPWGVQLAGSFSKRAALAAYARAQGAYAALLANIQPMIIGRRLMSRGFNRYYQIRAPAATRGDANALCIKISRLGGACVVLRT